MKPKRARRVAAFTAADAKQTGIAERQRNDGRVEIVLVAVLMQAHFGRRTVEVDQARFRRMRIAAEFIPGRKQDRRNRRPRLRGLRMGRRVPIAARIRDPTQRSAVRHPHRKRPPGHRHARREQRRCRKHLAQRGEQLDLAAAIQIARIEAKPARCIADGERRCGLVLPEVELHWIFATARDVPACLCAPCKTGLWRKPALRTKWPWESLMGELYAKVTPGHAARVTFSGTRRTLSSASRM